MLSDWCLEDLVDGHLSRNGMAGHLVRGMTVSYAIIMHRLKSCETGLILVCLAAL